MDHEQEVGKGRLKKKKTIFYPPLVDKGFTPPPLSTAIKVSVITLVAFSYPPPGPPPLSTKGG